jgi:hypothetical protein
LEFWRKLGENICWSKLRRSFLDRDRKKFYMNGRGKVMSERRSYAVLTRLRFHFTALLLFALIPLQSVFFASDVKAAIISWGSNSNGTGNGFSWQNGGSDYGLFGNPTLINGNTTLHFSPTNFVARSSGGKSAITSDRLQVLITASPGVIQGIRITESGIYDINSSGKVIDGGAIFITNLSKYETRSTTFIMNPVMPISSTSASSGSWSGGAAIEGLDWTYFQIVLNNNLTAKTQSGSQSFINKTSFDIEIDIDHNIPEPATLAVLTLGTTILPLCRRNKRH